MLQERSFAIGHDTTTMRITVGPPAHAPRHQRVSIEPHAAEFRLWRMLRGGNTTGPHREKKTSVAFAHHRLCCRVARPCFPTVFPAPSASEESKLEDKIMKKLLVLAALTVLTASSAGCCSSWYPGKYLGLGHKVGYRGSDCSSCGTAGATYIDSGNIAPIEFIESPGPVGG